MTSDAIAEQCVPLATGCVRRAEAFFMGFAVSLVLIAVPVKNLAYIVPVVFIAVQLLYGNTLFLARAFAWAWGTACVSLLAVTFDSFGGDRVNVPGLLLGTITFSTLAVMFGLGRGLQLSPEIRDRITTLVAWWIIAQSSLGLFQFVASGNHDAVCGTLGLLDFVNFDKITISQVYLTFNLFGMILFLLTDMRRALAKVAIVVGLLTCAVAHSGHQTLFLMAALGVVGGLQLRFRDLVKLGALLAVLVAVTASISAIRWSDIEGWYTKVVHNENSPKQLVARASVEILSSPQHFLLGVGMGQFGSRAALITSGEYLNVELPTTMVGQSRYYDTFVRPALVVYEEIGEGSAISQPYCSALNMLVEFGVPLTLIVLVIVARQFLDNRRLSRSGDGRTQIVGILANVGLIFLVLCCFIENYLEFPQAIFLPALLYIAARAAVDRGDGAPRSDWADDIDARSDTGNR